MKESRSWSTLVRQMRDIAKDRFLPRPVFDEFQKTFGGTSLEVVPLRYDGDGKIEVFMTQRPASDTYWPGELHVPGTMVFPWDWVAGNRFDAAWERLTKSEIIQPKGGQRVMVDTIFLNTKRGAETAVVFNLVFKGTVSDTGGSWYSISDLPTNIIEHHREIVFHGVHDFVGSVMAGNYSDGSLSHTAIENMVSQVTNFKRI